MSGFSAADTAPLLPHHNDNESTASSKRKERVGEFLESRRFHKLVLTLIAIDAICVLADLSYTFLSDECAPDHEEEPRWLTVLSYTSLAITSLFLAEIPAQIYAFSATFYNPFAHGPEAVHSGLHFLDAIVILGTFIIEVFLRGRERELASLLILVRLWRLVKLVSGVAVGVGETSEESERRLFELEASLKDAEDRLKQSEAENRELKAKLAELAPSPDDGVHF